MTEFVKSEYRFVIGCDPGPEHSAFALLEFDRLGPRTISAAYIRNDKMAGFSTVCDLARALDRQCGGKDFLRAVDANGTAYVFEKCGVQAGGANAMVFETCMTAGEIRHLFLNAGVPTFAFSPSDWRYVLTGKGCANDTMVRNLLLTLLPDCDILVRSCSMKAKKELNLRKPITSHLRDAAGVALASAYLEYRKGLSLSQFPGRLEVHCG